MAAFKYPVPGTATRSCTITLGSPSEEPAFDQVDPESVETNTPTSFATHHEEAGVVKSRAMALSETSGSLLPLEPPTAVKLGVAALVLEHR